MTIQTKGLGTFLQTNLSSLYGTGLLGAQGYVGSCWWLQGPVDGTDLYFVNSFVNNFGQEYLRLSATNYLGLFGPTSLYSAGGTGNNGLSGIDDGLGGTINYPGGGGGAASFGGQGVQDGAGQPANNGDVVRQYTLSQCNPLSENFYYGFAQHVSFADGGNGGVSGILEGGIGTYADGTFIRGLPWLSTLAGGLPLPCPVTFGGGAGGGGAGDTTHRGGGGGAGGAGGGALVLRGRTVAIDFVNVTISVRGGDGGNGGNGDPAGATGGGGGGSGGDGGIILIVAEQIELWDGNDLISTCYNPDDLFNTEGFYAKFDSLFLWFGGYAGGGGSGYNTGPSDDGVGGSFGEDGKVFWVKPTLVSGSFAPPSDVEIFDLVDAYQNWL